MCGPSTAAHFSIPAGIISTGRAREFFLLTEFVDGTGYFKDLERIRDGAAANGAGLPEGQGLPITWSEIHAEEARRTRRSIPAGSGSCWATANASWASWTITRPPSNSSTRTCSSGSRQPVWTGAGGSRTGRERLCRVHGDFHPWNILFREGHGFTVLDRSRGEWGEPADDVATMTINYIFFSLQRSGRLEGDLEKMFRLFWDTYLDQDRRPARCSK